MLNLFFLLFVEIVSEVWRIFQRRSSEFQDHGELFALPTIYVPSQKITVHPSVQQQSRRNHFLPVFPPITRTVSV